MSEMREFVAYLNTLHRCNGQNNNAVAESNYSNPFALDILYRDKDFINEVIAELREKKKVMLTGFAGDGKTTLAEEIVQEMTHELSHRLKEPREKFALDDGSSLVVVKDLSETSDNDIEELYHDICSNDLFLLVSNTGTVRTKLVKCKGYFKEVSELDLEERILEGLECGDNTYRGSIKLGESAHISVFNLVRRDNLDIAKNIFKKILDHKAWDDADSSEKDSVIALNVKLMKMNEYHAIDRMFLIYRRLYEYGHRMTIRNLIEHFAYTITGGGQSGNARVKQEFFFYNNFFGNGNRLAASMPGVQLVNSAQFGMDIDSSWKRRIWMDIGIEQYRLNIPDEVNEEFCRMVKSGGKSQKSFMQRAQTLRMIFFLNDVSDSDKEFARFIDSYLNSPGFSLFIKTNENGRIARDDEIMIKEKVRKVLAEYFLGIKIPENSGFGKKDKLFIALTRNSSRIHQTVQPIMGVVDWNVKNVRINVIKDSRGTYQFRLEINIRGNLVVMDMPLPFLDYILACNAGVVQNPQFTSFQKRLDNFKNKLLVYCRNDNDGIELVYQDVGNQLHHLSCSFDENRIYVQEM